MSFEDLVDKKIREAMARGEFDNLAGQGRPQDHSAYFATPEDLRLAYTVLKNGNYLPAEVELLREIAVLQERLAAGAQGVEAAAWRSEIAAKRLHFDVLMERRQRRPRGQA